MKPEEVKLNTVYYRVTIANSFRVTSDGLPLRFYTVEECLFVTSYGITDPERHKKYPEDYSLYGSKQIEQNIFDNLEEAKKEAMKQTREVFIKFKEELENKIERVKEQHLKNLEEIRKLKL